MKKKQNIEFTRGDDHEATYTIVDGAAAIKSLTGATSLKWEAFDSDGDAVLQKTEADDISLVDVAGTDDGVKVVFEPADTEDLTGLEFPCELECVIGGKRVTLAQGYLLLDEDYIDNP